MHFPAIRQVGFLGCRALSCSVRQIGLDCRHRASIAEILWRVESRGSTVGLRNRPSRSRSIERLVPPQ